MQRLILSLAMLCAFAVPQAYAQGAPDVVRATRFAPSLKIELDSATALPSGTYALDLTRGSGPVVVEGQPVTIRFAAWLPNGIQVQVLTQPETHVLNRGVFLRGVELGIRGMRVGGTRRLILPPSAAYGDRGTGTIPPNSVLVVDVTLIDQRG